MNPERLAEPRAIAVVFTAIVLVAALLVVTVGAGATLPAKDEAPITRERPDRLPSVAEGEAAARACEEAGSWRMGDTGVVPGRGLSCGWGYARTLIFRVR